MTDTDDKIDILIANQAIESMKGKVMYWSCPEGGFWAVMDKDGKLVKTDQDGKPLPVH